MKREKRLTKKERKALNPTTQVAAGGHGHHHHIHCTACGVHLELEQFDAAPPTAVWLRCEHGSEFSSCAACAEATRALLAEHDRTGQPVRHAAAWH